jgi:UDP-glucuronate decarboxylase
VDVVVHAASIASPTWYRERPLETIDVNVTGTRRMLDLARDKEASRFVLFSSSEIYGDPPPDRVPTTEDYWGNVSCTGPRACYDESKRLGETLATTYHRLHGLPVTIVRPFNVYGPRLRLDDRRVVPDFVRDALEGRQITLHSDGRVTRSFCYVTDAVVAILKLLVHDVGCEAYNVGNDDEVSIGELAALVDDVAGNGLGVRYQVSDDPAYLTDNPSRRAPDLTKLRAAIEWEPQVSLRDGIARTLAAHRGVA